MKFLISKITTVAALITLLLLLSGCFSSRTITQYGELQKAFYGNDPIRVLAIDSTLYTFDSFSFTDSTLTGTGSLKREKTTEEFEGTIPFHDIAFIEWYKPNYAKAIWILPMTFVIGSGTVALLKDRPYFDIIQRQEGSSCPFVYSYDGSDLILEAETFSTAISRSLETETYHVLSSLKNTGGELYVRISNERPETHLFNSVHLFAVDAPESASVVLDTESNTWALWNAVQPVIARDHSDNDILESLAVKDGVYWKSDLKNITPASGFRDTLVLQFERPPGASEANLVVDAINSELITEVYGAAGTIIGDESLMFYRALEQDPELINYFRDWTRKSSLRVEVKNNGGWKVVGTLLPEANEVPFSRAIHLENLDHFGEALTVRLSSMTDVWHIDAVSVDYTDQEPLALHPLQMTAAKASNGQPGVEVESALGNSDSLYAMVLPPDYMDLTFDASPAEEMLNPQYILAARGYLYEWFPEPDDSTSAAIPDWFNDVDRNEMLKLFARQEDLFLASIYARWNRKQR